jgi:hypothetical protein
MEGRQTERGTLEALTSPLLKGSARPDADLRATDAELASIVKLAHNRGAHSIAIGSGRTANAIATSRAIKAAWDGVGGRTLGTVTWPETGASWLRHATRLAAIDPDLWIMTGPATGWAQMTRRLLWSTQWTPARTLATAEIGAPQTLGLVGLPNLDRLTGAEADGATWLVTPHGLVHPETFGSTR